MNDLWAQEQTEEQCLCGEFWVWLYEERRRRDWREPSDDEKNAHPALVALRQLRQREDQERAAS